MKEDAPSKNNREYKVSVIIPVYNAERTLERAFLSVKNQTIGFENIELLFCDDCSTDGSYALIKKWAAEYPNVKVFQTKKNSGMAGAPRNVCLDNASAPYVMFLDSDDGIYPNACFALYSTEKESGADIVSGDYGVSFEKGASDKEILSGSKTFKEARAGRYDLSKNDELNHPHFRNSFWTKLYRRELLNKYNIHFVERAAAEDVVFLFLYLSVCMSGQIIHEDIINYTVNKISASHGENEFYFRTVAEAFLEGAEEAKRIGTLERYLRLIEASGTADYNLERLIKSRLDKQTITRILPPWRELLKLLYEKKLNSTSAFTRTLMYDAAKGSAEDFAFVLNELREFSALRQSELDDILGSRSWRLVSKARGLFKV